MERQNGYNGKNPFRALNVFDYILWGVSVLVITLSFVLSPRKDPLTLASSLIGVTSLALIAKGNVWGQILMIGFAVTYGVVSFFFKYYGEMITYLGMSLPAAVFSLVSWVRHPFRNSGEVEIGTLNAKKCGITVALAAATTVAFYFILNALGTANIVFSTVSVATSVLAATLSFFRSPLYAIGYCANDIVLIVLWSLATAEDYAYFPMIFCFVMFLLHDINGFVNWTKRRNRQRSAAAPSTNAPTNRENP